MKDSLVVRVPPESFPDPHTGVYHLVIADRDPGVEAAETGESRAQAQEGTGCARDGTVGVA
jgi:hypothetical protein